MTTNKIDLDGNTVTIYRAFGDRTETLTIVCVTRRAAEVRVAMAELEAIGWRTCYPVILSHFRRPIGATTSAAPGHPFDAAYVDAHALGFTAHARGESGAHATVDACAGLPVLLVNVRGDIDEVREVVAKWLAWPEGLKPAPAPYVAGDVAARILGPEAPEPKP